MSSHFKGQRQIPKATQADPVILWQWTRGSGAKTQSFREGSYAGLRARFKNPDKTIWDSITLKPNGSGPNGQSDWWRADMAQADDQINDTQEVVGSNLTQSKLLNQVLINQFIALGVPVDDFDGNPTLGVGSVISQISSLVNKFKADAQTYTFASLQGDVALLVPTLARNLAWRFMNDLNQNGDTCLQSQYCFRRTLTMSQRAFDDGGQTLFAGIFDDTDVVFTETMLRAVESIPDFFELPPKVINNSQDAFWLKQPTHSRFDNNKREITLEYLFADEWSDLYYA